MIQLQRIVVRTYIRGTTSGSHLVLRGVTRSLHRRLNDDLLASGRGVLITVIGLISIEGHLVVSTNLRVDARGLKLLRLTHSICRLLHIYVASALPVSSEASTSSGLAFTICVCIRSTLLPQEHLLRLILEEVHARIRTPTSLLVIHQIMGLCNKIRTSIRTLRNQIELILPLPVISYVARVLRVPHLGFA